jgi:hypothetical protein
VREYPFNSGVLGTPRWQSPSSTTLHLPAGWFMRLFTQWATFTACSRRAKPPKTLPVSSTVLSTGNTTLWRQSCSCHGRIPLQSREGQGESAGRPTVHCARRTCRSTLLFLVSLSDCP